MALKSKGGPAAKPASRKGGHAARSTTANEKKESNRRWRTAFFKHLAESSNVTQACAQAEISPSTVYDLRRRDNTFAARWMEALCEGYDNLEIELLQRLRSGESKDEQTGRKFDNAGALRLLAAHRATVGRERAMRDHRSEKDVLASIDDFIDRMRERSAANARILEGRSEDAADDGS